MRKYKKCDKMLYEKCAKAYGNNNNIRQMYDRTYYQMQKHGDEMCDKMDCKIVFEVTVPSNHPAYSKNLNKT